MGISETLLRQGCQGIGSQSPRLAGLPGWDRHAAAGAYRQSLPRTCNCSYKSERRPSGANSGICAKQSEGKAVRCTDSPELSYQPKYPDTPVPPGNGHQLLPLCDPAAACGRKESDRQGNDYGRSQPNCGIPGVFGFL